MKPARMPGISRRARPAAFPFLLLALLPAAAIGQAEGPDRRGTDRPGHTADVFSIAISPDGKTLASAGGDGLAKLWVAGTGRVRADLAGHEGRVACVAFAPDG